LLKYPYRVIAIPLATLLLIAGAILYGTIILPFRIYVLRKKSIEETRHAISRGIKRYLGVLRFFNLLKLRVINYDKARDLEPVIFIANHPSIFDILFFISLFPTASCIAKKSLKNHSPYSLVVRWGNYITAKKDSNILDQANKEISAGNSVIIFPEGTRSSKKFHLNGSGKYKFHRGAANLHLLSKTRIIPITIKCSPLALAKDQRWYEVPNKVCEVEMFFHTDFEFKKDHDHQYRTISSRTITQELEEFFEHNR